MSGTAPEPSPALSASGCPAQRRLVTLLFTDVVGSVALKQQLGDRDGIELLQRHHGRLRETLAVSSGAQEIETAGDSFLILFPTPSEGVRCALRLQTHLAEFNRGQAVPALDRMGLHVGEVTIEETGGGRRRIHGMQVDTCARVMSLAQGGQILMTRATFDNARQSLKGEEIEGTGALTWLNHGRYELKGVEEPVEICEVRMTAGGSLSAPATSEKVRRVSDEGEAVLGWRPAAGQLVPGRPWMLERNLGEGGFGEVWLARHQTLSERRVFKFCFRADRVRSLRREVTLFRLLKERVGEHPNIVRVLEVCFEQPPYYLEMEYAEGQDLAAWCAAQGGANRVSVETKLELVAQVADALQAAHQAGVIHRDVKPANILIAECGVRSSESPARNQGFELRASNLVAKLTDFGIGQVVSEECLAGITRAGFTQTLVAEGGASQSGTQLFMAPELLSGKSASTRSDIYSLGVVLFQLLVGDFRRPVTTDWEPAIGDSLLREDLRRCFAGDPRDRFTAAGQLAESLRSWGQRCVERSAAERAQAQSERRRRLLLAVSGVAAVLVALAASLGIGMRQAQIERERQRLFAYASDMRAADVALQETNLAQAIELLRRHVPERGQTDLRGIEWRYLWQSTRGEQRALWRHPSRVCAVAISADDHWVATVGADHQIRVWPVDSQQPVKVIPGLASDYGEAAVCFFSPRSDWLLTQEADGLGIWRVADWQRVATLPSTQEAVDVSRDGRLLAALGEQGLRLWETATWKLLASHPITNYWSGQQHRIVFDAAGTHLIESTETGLRIWDVRTGRQTGEYGGVDSPASVAVSPDGRWVAAGTWLGRMQLWSARTGEPVLNHPAEPGALFGLAFSPDGETLATGGNSQVIRLWRAGTTNLLSAYTGHFGEIWGLQFSRDGEWLISASADGTARLWLARPLPGDGFSVPEDEEVLRIARNGSRLWLANTNLTTLFERELPSFRLERTTVLQTSGITELPSPDDRLPLITERALLCGSPDGHLWGWDWETGALILTNRVSEGFVRPLAATTNAGLAYGLEATSSQTNGVLWNLELGGAEAVFADAAFTGWAAFSPDGRWLVFGARDRSWRLYDVAHHRERAVLRGHEWNPYCARFAADGRRVVTCGWEPAPRIWDVSTCQMTVPPLVGHRSGVHQAAFPPDGRTLMTCGSDRTLRFWNVATGQEVTLARPCSLALFYSGVLAPDGSGLLETGQDRTLRYTRIPSLEEIDSGERNIHVGQPGKASTTGSASAN